MIGSDNTPLVSFLVLTMNRSTEIEPCLESIFAQDYPNYEVIVIDNASVDNTCSVVSEKFPKAKLFRMEKNLGAAGGRNVAFSKSVGEICIVIDDDAELSDINSTLKIVNYFRCHNSLGALSLNVKNAFTNKVDVKAIPRRDKKILSADYPCTYFCAAGVALKRQAFSQAGGFWDKLFIYAEELDLSYRIIDKGFDIIHCVSIDVMHSETPSARPNDRYLRLASRNRIWVAFRNLPFPNAVVMSVAWSIKHALMSIKTGQLLAVLDGLKLALLGLKYAIQKRKKLTPGTMKKLQELSGRVWY